MGKVFACGCSYTVGMGLWDHNNRYTKLLADKLGYEEVNLAVVGSSNYGVYLQAKYAIEEAEEDDIVIISDTSFYRCEFYDDKKAAITDPNILTVHNIDYSGDHNTNLGYFEEDDLYKGDLRMGQFWQDYDGENMFNFFKRDGSKKKMKAIAEFYALHHPTRVKIDNDISLYSSLHLYALKKNVKHVMMIDMDQRVYFDTPLYDEQNYMHHNWFDLSTQYPDKQGTMHCDEEGHAIVANTLMDKVRENRWIL